MKQTVTFAEHSPLLASTRLRATIPQRELAALGVERGRDVLVIGKHGFDWDKATAGYRKVVYDVCDDHFGDELSEFYQDACTRADAITCNSLEMRRIVRERTATTAAAAHDGVAPQGAPGSAIENGPIPPSSWQPTHPRVSLPRSQIGACSATTTRPSAAKVCTNDSMAW